MIPTRAAVFLISKVFLLMKKHFSFCVLAYVDKIRTAKTVDQDVDQDSVGHECGWVGGGGAGHVLYSHSWLGGSTSPAVGAGAPAGIHPEEIRLEIPRRAVIRPRTEPEI